MRHIDRMLASKAAFRRQFYLGIFVCIALLLGVGQPRVQAFISIRETVEGAMTDLFQGSVEIGSAELSSLSRLSVRNLVVRDPLDDASVILEVDELVVRYSIIGLVLHIGNIEKAVQEITLRSPRLSLRVEEDGQWNLGRLFKDQPGGDGNGGLCLRVEKGQAELVGPNLGIGTIAVGLDGALNAEGSSLRLEQTLIRLFDSEFRAHGAFDDGVIDLTLKGSQIDLAKVTALFPQTKEITLRGQATVELRAGGTLDEPLLDGMISMGRGSLSLPAYANAEYSIDALEAFFRYTEDELEMTKLEIAQREARFQARGVIDVKGNMHLDMIAQAFDLARNLQFIASYGIGGRANMAGVLTGTVLQPNFQGELYIAGGTLRGQPYDELRGHVTMDLKDARITGCNIRKDRSIYAITGTIGFGRTPQVDLAVQSSGGRAEDLLAVLNIPGDLSGRVDGTLEFQGVPAHMLTKGQIHMSDGRFQEQGFAWAQGEFVVGPEMIRISEGSMGLGDGTLHFSGATQTDGLLVLEINAQNIRAEKILLLQDLADSLQGTVNLAGTAAVKGTLAKPWLRMLVSASNTDQLWTDAAPTTLDVVLNGRQVMINEQGPRPAATRPH